MSFNIISAEEAAKISMNNLRDDQELRIQSTINLIKTSAERGWFSVSFQGSDEDYRLCCKVFRGYKITMTLSEIRISW